MKNQKGAVPLLLLFTGLGLLVFLFISNTFSFKDRLFNTLFPKPPSHAMEGYFPLGVFESDSVTNSREKFEAMIADSKAHGLDAAMWMVQGPLEDPNVIRLRGYPHTKLGWLDISDRENFGVIFNPANDLASKWFSNTATASATIENARLIATPLVDKLKTHPSVKGYYIVDEPDVIHTEKVRLMTQTFREADNSRPAFPVLIGEDRVGPIFSAASPAVMTINVYPFGASNAACSLDMTGFGYAPNQEDFVSYIRKVTRDKPVGTPLWIILQAHRFLNPGDRFALREPSVEELRLESWLSIGEGVKGIFYFIFSSQQGWTGLKDNPTLFNEVKAFADRINPLKSTLFGLHRIDDASFSVSGNNYISILTDGTKKYLVIVNKSCSLQDITVSTTVTGNQLKDLETNTVSNFGSAFSLEGGNGRIFEVVAASTSPSPTPSPTSSPTITPTPAGYAISGFVYKDDNGNNRLDEGKEGLGGGFVSISNSSNVSFGKVGTSNGGYYILRNLPNGNYTVTLTQPNLLPVGYALSSRTISVSLNGGDATGTNFRLVPTTTNLLINANFEASPNHLNGWGCQGTGSGTCTIVISPEATRSYIVELIPRSEAWGRQVGQGNILTILDQSETFCLSGYINKSASAHATLAIQHPSEYWRQIEKPTSAVVGSWALFKQTVTKPAWPGNKLAVYVRNYTNNIKVSFDEISLTRGACQ